MGSAFQQRYLLQTLEQRVKARTRELNALYELASLTSETTDFTALLRDGLDVLLNALDKSKGVVYTINAQTQSPELVAYKGWQRVKRSAPVFRRLQRQAQKVLLHKGPLLIANKPMKGKSHDHSNPMLENFLGIPLSTQDITWGCICVIAEADCHFSPEDVALLSAVADQLNQARERASLQLHLRRIAVNEERQRLARELHDAVTQSVYSLSLLASASQRAMKAGKYPNVSKYLEELENNALQSLKEMRLFIYELRPDAFFQEGFVQALAHRLELVEQRANLNTQFIVEGEINLSEEQEYELYGIAQEVLNNSLKHAAARSIVVWLKGSKRLVTLQIKDDGVGFDVNSPTTKRGLGLINLQERTDHLHGKLDIHSSSAGTMVQISITVRLKVKKRSKT